MTYDEYVITAARAVCLWRSDDWSIKDDRANAMLDAREALHAVGFVEVLASRERAINLAVALEQQLSDAGMTGLLLDNLP